MPTSACACAAMSTSMTNRRIVQRVGRLLSNEIIYFDIFIVVSVKDFRLPITS